MGVVFLDLASIAGRREVDDVCKATVVNEDPFGIESFCREHYDQGVVMRLLHSTSIFFVERHVLVCPSLLERGYHVDVIHLSLVCFLEGFE